VGKSTAPKTRWKTTEWQAWRLRPYRNVRRGKKKPEKKKEEKRKKGIGTLARPDDEKGHRWEQRKEVQGGTGGKGTNGPKTTNGISG